MSGSTDYVFDDFARICDICGKPRESQKLTYRDGIAICTLHPGYRRAQELDKINARRRVPVVKPVKNTKPLSPDPTWEVEEGRILDLVCSVAPFETNGVASDGAPGVTGVRSFRAAGWGMVYLLSLVTEARRPAAWRSQALAKATALGDYLISVQQGNGASPSFTLANNVSYGAFLRADNRNYSGDAGIACVALCKLYQTTGTSKYLAAAKNAAHFVVNTMAGDLIQVGVTTAIAYNVPTRSVSVGDAFDNFYYPQDLVCLWALSLLLSIAGDATYGCPGTAGGAFSASPARLLSLAIAQVRAFWTTGVAPAGSSAVVNGLSATTPKEFFNGGNRTWNMATGTQITSANWCEGIHALTQVDGVSSQVSALWMYLMTFASAAAFETPSHTSAHVLAAGLTGTYDPTVAPAVDLDVSTVANAGSTYNLAASGLLAAIRSARTPGALATLKEAFAVPRPRYVESTPRSSRVDYLQRLGLCGLSFQTAGIVAGGESVTRAAQAGNVYRYRQAFMGDE